MGFRGLIRVAKLVIMPVVFVMVICAVSVSAAERGKLLGGMAHHYPDWFKSSFLDLKEDAGESADENKHTILFMSLNGCPYCTRMLNTTFVEDRALIEKDFDVVGINIRGDRTITAVDGDELTEKQFARKVRVRFTPTILFLDGEGKAVFRINGYWDPAQFRKALAFVRTNSYESGKIGEYLNRLKSEKIWDFQSHELLSNATDFSNLKKPLLVLFEDAGCTACAELHGDLLARDEVKKRLADYEFVRLDSRSKSAIVDVDGNATTASDWAVKLGVTTAPTFIAFDKGKERQRIESRLYSHHFISILEYVSGGHYKEYDNWLRYNSARTKKVLDQGVDVDLSDGRSKASN